MNIKNVTILTDSPKIYKDLLIELRKRNVRVTDNGEIKVRIEKINDKKEILKYVGYIVALSRGKQEFNELLIGIDTNSSYLTIVVLIDGELIEFRRANNLEKLLQLIDEILLTYPAKRKIIGVGIGNKYGRQIFDILSRKYENVRDVDEKHTNIKTHFNQIKDKDLRAAYSIALRASS
ncbi:hypothetical protein [Saccharolobus caldissimus]|uniref:Uncharacterized protein n=1 Tax=Saccharolobus caldissimus TaxID=1702097 RepID=A0AAQ4CPG6_9CREN|nr:hypothetical protein [Saccharolobus caldissimus]BDB97697.1 hypothetical protein SACC_07140 [Saccharolobus caldissimus]